MKDERKKLDLVAKECVLVEYGTKVKGYYILTNPSILICLTKLIFLLELKQFCLITKKYIARAIEDGQKEY